MTIAPNESAVAAAPTVDDSAAAAVSTLLPAREAVLARLAERLPATETMPACLLVIGLLRRDDRRTTASTLAQVTTLLANSLRADDWLASSGPAEFVVVMSGPATGGRVAADRLVAAISTTSRSPSCRPRPGRLAPLRRSSQCR